MSHMQPIKPMTTADIQKRKGQTSLVCLTAYTAPMAEILDPHCDILLVGDSVGMVMHGLPDTLGVTMDMMILHARAVMRGAKQALVVVDMPFGAYENTPEQAFDNATRLLKETGAAAVKLESGPAIADTIAHLTARGVPVMGHVGLRPQAARVDGGFKVKGKTEDSKKQVIADARAAQAAGAFAIVVEGVAEDVAQAITQAVDIPTIGIGASAVCDGQILVTEDMLGLFEWTPKFVKQYGQMRDDITQAITAYADDVRNRTFPGPEQCYIPRSLDKSPRTASKHHGTVEGQK